MTRDDSSRSSGRCSTAARFDWSAAISVAERPEAYKGGAGGGEVIFDHADAVVEPAGADGRARVGQGEKMSSDTTSTSSAPRGTPAPTTGSATIWARACRLGRIEIIDDSPGTLTAPIIDQFAGMLCAGGTVRSHLGILSREFGIPCFMSTKLSGIRDGDRIEMEASAAPRTTEDYQSGTDQTGRVWTLEPA